MKRCPECRRDYFDDSLSYCLDDGSVLVDGPLSRDEPATAIIDSGRHHQLRSSGSAISANSESDRSIVVLPFTNIGSGGEDDYFCDGLTEELISDLSKVRSLRVISRNSALRLKGTTKDLRTIADELNVRYVVDGSVRKSGPSLRVSVQLIDGLTDANLWSEKYTGTLDDVFEMQENVSRSVVDALKITLSSDEIREIEQRPISNPKVYDLYFRARAEFLKGERQALDRSIDLLNEGLKIMGENELLYAALGYCYFWYFRWISKTDESYLEQARRCMEKVFELDPNSSHGYTLRGMLSYSDGDMLAALRSLRKAVELDPTNTEALLSVAINGSHAGDNVGAARYVKALLEIDPLLPINVCIQGFVHLYAGEFEKAMPCLEKALKMDPASPLLVWSAAIAAAWCGEAEKAIAYIDDLTVKAPDWIYTQHGLFLKHALRGEKQEALVYATDDLRKESEHDCHFALHVAHCYAMIGEVERGLDFLELAVNRGMVNVPFLCKIDPLLENVRGRDRFEEIVEKARPVYEQILAEDSGVATNARS
jgi:non-specific serine/threonine protein kinase